MMDPFDLALATAGIDNEPLTDEERGDIESSRAWFQHNEGTPFEEAVKQLELTMEEVTNYKDNS